MTTEARAPALLRAALAIAGLFAVAALVQLRSGAPIDADTAYHVAVGRMIAAHGILTAFPWTPFSWLAGHYADKELAFHLAFVPLARVDWITAAKIVGAIWGGACLAALYLILRAEKVRWAAAWAVAPLLVSPVFSYRFALVRPHLASIALAALILWAATRRRYLILALAAAAYPWLYVGWTLAVVMVGVAEAARMSVGERPGWRTIAVVLGGLAVGFLLHPNAANLLRMTWITSVDILLRNAWGRAAALELGDEFRSFRASEWLSLLAGASAAAIAAASLASRSRDPVDRAFAIAAVGFALLTVKTARFAEYFVPFSVLGLALAGRAARWRWLPAAVAAGAFLVSAPELWRQVIDDLPRQRPHLPERLALKLAESIPAGAQVFTCGWGHTGTLMIALPERRFMVALDPTLFHIADPDLYALWFSLPRTPPEHPAEIIRSRFGSRYVVCQWEDRFRRFFNRLSTDSTVGIILFDDWVAYDLGR